MVYNEFIRQIMTNETRNLVSTINRARSNHYNSNFSLALVGFINDPSCECINKIHALVSVIFSWINCEIIESYLENCSIKLWIFCKVTIDKYEFTEALKIRLKFKKLRKIWNEKTHWTSFYFNLVKSILN